MRYKFFICKPVAMCECLVSRALRRYVADGEKCVGRRDLLSEFDAERLTKLLRVASGEAAGFDPKLTFRQVADLPLVSVWTSYRKAQEVVEALGICVSSVGAVLFDGEMDFTTDASVRDRARFVSAWLAHQRLRIALQKMPALTESLCSTCVKYFQLGHCFYREGIIDTAIMIIRGSMVDVVKAVNEVLRSALTEGEVLYCSSGCFVVESKSGGYKIRFVVEGPGKSAQYMGWIENGEVHLEMLRRMSLCQAIKAISGMGRGELELIRSRLYFDEAFATRGELRNPADRFVDSYKMSRRLNKFGLDIVYGYHPFGNRGEYDFYFCNWHNLGWDAWKGQSYFTMTEEDINLLMAIFESVVPYYSEYYYDDFHFRKEESKQILVKIRSVRQEVIKDPTGQSLGVVGQRLLYTTFACRYPDGRITSRYDEEKFDILRQNRSRIVAMLDFFAWWLRGRIDACRSSFHGFHVVGP
jgi:hypothetical protein